MAAPLDLAPLTDHDLENLQNAAYRERLARLQRDALSSGKHCGMSPIGDGAAMTLADEGPRPSADAGSLNTTAQPRSFAPPRSIGWAIKQLHKGSLVTRAGWNGRRQHLGLQLPDARSRMTLPYLYIRTVQGDRVPWLASQTDLLATDWQLAS